MMAEDRGTLRSVAWQQIFPSLRLLGAIRMALNMKALLLGAIAMAGMVAGWRVIDGVDAWLAPGTVAERSVEPDNIWPWERPLPVAPAERLTSLGTWYTQSPLVAGWNELTVPFHRMVSMNEAPTFANFMYLLGCALWSLVVWSFFGGAISRQAAVAFARQENVSLGQLARFVHGRWSAYFVAPLLPMLGAALVALLLAGVGAIMRLEVGVFVASLIWPLVLLGGFVMAFLLLGLFFGFPLMWGAISAEGTDAFGALSHAYSYVYQRPLRYLCYTVIGALAGVLGWYLVTLFAYWIIDLSRWGISWGSGVNQLALVEGYESMGRVADTGAAIILFWTNCLNLLAYGFIFSYFWTSTTTIYFLLRRLVDATELDEVFMPGDQAKHGLPSLKTGPDGMPRVDDASPEASPAAAPVEPAG
jgi:hypothetical protein